MTIFDGKLLVYKGGYLSKKKVAVDPDLKAMAAMAGGFQKAMGVPKSRA